MPDWVKESSYLLSDLDYEYERDFNSVLAIYNKWQAIEKEAKKEDTAKLFLPLMSTTDLVMSGNIQAMYEFLMLRNCVRASEEIREMSQTLTQLLSEQDGLIGMIFSDLDCKGKEFGYCPEHESCGKYEGR